jgi:tetratricopeptide (TPR) repeat protein
MKRADQSVLSPEQLLELERICDSFESDLERGNLRDIAAYLNEASPAIRSQLQAEFESVIADCQPIRIVDTRSDWELTGAPQDLLTRHDGMIGNDLNDATSSLSSDRNNRERFGRFRLDSIVGRGGAGVVWKAFDESLNRCVALKIPHPHSVTDAKQDGRVPQLPEGVLAQGNDAIAEAIGLFWSANRDRNQHHYKPAIQKYDQLLGLIHEKVGENNPIHALALGDFGGLYWRSGDYRSAYPMIVKALEVSRPMAPAHPKRMQAMMKLAFELQLAHRHAEAQEWLLEAAANSSDNWNDDEGIQVGLTVCYLEAGAPEKAIAYSQKLVDDVSRYTAEQTAWYSFLHARVLSELGRERKAGNFRSVAFETIDQTLQLQRLPRHSTWARRRGCILLFQNRYEEAATVFEHACQMARKEYNDHHPRVAGLMAKQAECFIRMGRPDRAKDLLVQALSIQAKSLPVHDRRIEISRSLLAQTQASLSH